MNTCSTRQSQIPSSSTSNQRISIILSTRDENSQCPIPEVDRTPPCERNHGTGKRDFDIARNPYRADQPSRDERSTRSESSAGRRKVARRLVVTAKIIADSRRMKSAFIMLKLSMRLRQLRLAPITMVHVTNTRATLGHGHGVSSKCRYLSKRAAGLLSDQ